MCSSTYFFHFAIYVGCTQKFSDLLAKDYSSLEKEDIKVFGENITSGIKRVYNLLNNLSYLIPIKCSGKTLFIFPREFLDYF